MYRKTIILAVILALALGACGGAASSSGAASTIKIGINAPLTGDIPKVGEGTKDAAQMWLSDIQAAGGIDVGGVKHPVQLVIEDNESKAESATSVNTKLITQDKVLVIVGPQASSQAVPAGQVANNLKTPMISPWSTNPGTTKDRPWVFRTPFLDSFQGQVDAQFATSEFKATKAAVLYDIGSDYPKGLADYFKTAWESEHGAGSVVAFETFSTGDKDFSAQLTKIKDSGADFLFTPQYYNEVPLIVKQAHQLGFNKPILGSDSWGSAELMNLCGSDCYGLFFSTHYAAAGATGATKTFIDRYNQQYGYIPDDVAALTWDSMNIVQQAIQNCGKLTGDLATDRQCVRDGMANIGTFKGITGTLKFDSQGDPTKCAVIVKISNTGEFDFYKSVCPPGLQ